MAPALAAALPSMGRTDIPTPQAVADATTDAHKAIAVAPFAIMIGGFLLHYFGSRTLDKLLK